MPEKSLELIAYLSKFQHVIWDWNGTILNDTKMVVDVNNQMLVEQNLDTISVDEYRRCFVHPIKTYYEGLGFDFEKVSFESLGDRFIELYEDKIKEVKIFPAITGIFQSLQGAGVGQSILSASHQERLRKWVVEHGVSHFFENVYAIDDHYAASKVQRGHDLIKQLSSNKSDVVMVGDTDHDYEVAHDLGIDIVLIANGHQSEERLRKLTEKVFS